MNVSFSRKLLAPALLAVAIAPLALSAIAGPHHRDAAQRQQWQEARVEQRQALFERAGLDQATREALDEAHGEHREAMRELHERHRERLAEILDDDQRAALEAARRDIREERRSERRERMQERLEALVDEWGLSEEEREALRETREAIYADMAELRDRDFDSREARREALREMRDEHRAALAELLSDEQLEELQSTIRRSGYRPHGKSHGHHGGRDARGDDRRG
ncbi:hypothetical protein [Halomonas sp. C05BenzN]|uniref:hypothetical protein n=1 Tax=Halomonas sp. C05BenzN TaxID=3411041 RepID=UPI003B94120F